MTVFPSRLLRRRGLQSARSNPHSVRVALFCLVWPCCAPSSSLLTQSTLHAARHPSRRHDDHAINTLCRHRITLRYAARNAARTPAAALRRAALHERRPHQVGKRLRARRVTSSIRLVAILVTSTPAADSRLPSDTTPAHERHALLAFADAGSYAHAQQQQLHPKPTRSRVCSAATADV